MAEFAQLDVKEIVSDVPRSNFTEEQIEQLADLILEGGGVIRPLVVKQVDIDRYQLLDGAFEYYGAVRAREKEPRQGELVNAFVVSPKTEAVIHRQIELLQPQDQTETTPQPTAGHAEPTPAANGRVLGAPDQLTAFVTNFVVGSEKRINDLREEQFQFERKMEGRIGELEKALETKRQSDLLETINTLPDAELITQLTFYGLDATRSQAICSARSARADGRFQGYMDLLSNTKGLGERGLLGLIDRWQQMHR